MKTLDTLKEFSLDKKQMNEVNGGLSDCDKVIIEGNQHGKDWDDWDGWFMRFEAACL